MAALDKEEFLKRHLKLASVLNERHIRYTVDELQQLIAEALELMKSEPPLATIRPPVVIVGDIHGQYNDLLRVFSMFATAKQVGALSQKYLFLGDYVDRGRRSLECICLCLVLKLIYPKKYMLLRGNHESKNINRVYGFFDEIADRFEKNQAEQLWAGFNEVFSWMPLAGLVGSKILCMHGGISKELNSFDDIRALPRPIVDPTPIVLAMDLLWADPMCNTTGFTTNTIRGVSTYFGEDTVDKLCTNLNIDMIVRGHQVMMTGIGFFANRKLVTVFTAPRYQPETFNKGAVMFVDKEGKVGFKVLAPLDDVNSAAEPSTETQASARKSSSASAISTFGTSRSKSKKPKPKEKSSRKAQ